MLDFFGFLVEGHAGGLLGELDNFGAGLLRLSLGGGGLLGVQRDYLFDGLAVGGVGRLGGRSLALQVG